MPAAVNMESRQALEATRQDGTIKSVNKDRGYGFITGADGFKYFWHLSSLMDRHLIELKEGDTVSFILRDTGHPGGPVADRIYFNNQNIITIKGDI